MNFEEEFLIEKEIENKLSDIGKDKKSKDKGDRKEKKSKDEGDPTGWIKADDDDSGHHRTKHGNAHHEFTYRHMEAVHPGAIKNKNGKYDQYTCNPLTDKWWEWFLKTPASVNAFTNPGQPYHDRIAQGTSNGFLLRDEFSDKDRGGNTIDGKIFVYFGAASAFLQPDVRTIVMTERAPLLVPVYNMSASAQDYPSISQAANLNDKLTEMILEDLRSVTSLQATFDRVPIQGCCVVRCKPMKVTDIPKDNVHGVPEENLIHPDRSINTCHGGFWLLIRKDKLTSGDHLLEFSADSKNYEIAAKLFINVLA